MRHAQIYLVAGGVLAAGLIAFAWTWLQSRRVGGDRIATIVATVAFDSSGVTDGKSLAMAWSELEKVTLAGIKDGEAPGAVLLQLSGNGKAVFIARTAAGWDDLFERLASLPGADPSSFEAARLAVTPGCGLVLSLWEKTPAPSGPATLAVSRGSKPELASYLSQTLIRWIPGEDAFELARFEKEPKNVTERLIVPYAALDGFRIWWRGAVLMSGWRYFDDDEHVPKLAPPAGYYCLQIWPNDQKWAAFQIDLAHDAMGEQLDPILANLAVDWYGRLGSAVKFA